MAMAANTNPKRNGKSKTDPNSSSMTPSETHSVLFEWPLSGLKSMFDSTKADTKSRVVKSTSFGGGRWTVLFYAQSGTDQFCSLYLNAEPLPHERTQSLDAKTWIQAAKYDQTKAKSELEDYWSREGNYRFIFTIQTPDKSVVLGTKEANNHMFSMKTSNWGWVEWAQFSKRDTVYYGNQMVKSADQFVITVSITASAERPRLMKPLSLNVPPQLLHAMGSLLDDPDHSDVVFHLVSQRPSRSNNRRSKHVQEQAPVKKIYAIKKILSSRSEYFADMFEGGFAEAECADFSEDDDATENERSDRQLWSPESPPSKDLNHNTTSDSTQAGATSAGDTSNQYELGKHGEATPATNSDSNNMDVDDEFYSDDEEEEEALILEDSDEELEGTSSSNDRQFSPVTFRSTDRIQSSRFNSRKYRGGAAGNGRIGGEDGDEDEEDQDDEELVEEDEVVGISKPPSGMSHGLSTSTPPPAMPEFEHAGPALTSSSTSNSTSIENAVQTGGNQEFTFGSLSVVDNRHTATGMAQTQNHDSGLTSTAGSSSLYNNPEIPTQSHMSRTSSSSTSNRDSSSTSVPVVPPAVNLLSAQHSSSNPSLSKTVSPSSPNITPNKKSRLAQSPKSSINATSKRSREKLEAANRPTDRRKRRKVVVRDSAYNTYKALLYYLYTDTITFAPLTSSFLTPETSAQNDLEGDSNMKLGHRITGLNAEYYQEEFIKAHKRRQAMIEWWCSQNPDKPSPCSAKAMYKLADKLQIPELKRRAREHIAASLTVQNIVWEVFSAFNAQFAEIRKMETDYLLQHWSVIKKSSAMKTIFFRSQAHPGLAEVWPYLLSQLEYKASGDDSDSEAEPI